MSLDGKEVHRITHCAYHTHTHTHIIARSFGPIMTAAVIRFVSVFVSSGSRVRNSKLGVHFFICLMEWRALDLNAKQFNFFPCLRRIGSTLSLSLCQKYTRFNDVTLIFIKKR